MNFLRKKNYVPGVFVNKFFINSIKKVIVTRYASTLSFSRSVITFFIVFGVIEVLEVQ